MSRARQTLLAIAGAVLAASCSDRPAQDRPAKADPAEVQPAKAPPPKGQPADPRPMGIFGDVRMSEETGDLGGIEVRFFEQGGRHMAEVVLCEGWCNKAYVSPVTRTDKGYTFGYIEGGTGGRLTFLAVPVKDGLDVSLEFDYAGEDQPREVNRLTKLEKPFGLDVAKSPQN